MRKSVWSLFLSVFVLLSSCVILSGRVCAEDADPAGGEGDAQVESHSLGFASDLHGTEKVLGEALEQFSETPEYVSLVGDMVGAKGGDAPAFYSGDVLKQITDVYGNINKENKNASIIWADHDGGVFDDAEIVQCMGDPAGYFSGQIYEGKKNDGSTAYYIYGIGFYHMTKGGSISQDAAAAFKEWVAGLDKSIPVIVVCHVPLQAKRGDNLGAYYWNEALNYAATGVENITVDDLETVPIIRDVVYLYGHNHTADTTEYVFKAGTTMSVQVDPANTPLMTGEYADRIVETEVYDEEYAEEQGSLTTEPNATAKGLPSTIYYTALIPGYLKTSNSATMLTITDDAISFTKYNGSGAVDLGKTDGGETVASPYVIERIQVGDEPQEDELEITVQPVDAYVAYPEPAQFHVEVNHPERVASYEWYLSDGYKLFQLDGESAGTDTLVIPATTWSENPYYIECVITDVDGNRYFPDDAELVITNQEESFPLLYVGEYAVLPGETLDLSETICGSGTVTFAADANSITLNNVTFHNETAIMDTLLTPSNGLYLTGVEAEEHPEFAIHCIGDNIFTNSFFDASSNSGGVTANLFFGYDVDTDVPVEVTFDGDGSLTLIGGERCINADANLTIDTTLTAQTYEKRFCDAIRGIDITICEDTNVVIESVGAGITGEGTVTVGHGASIRIDMGLPYYVNGTGTAAGIRGNDGVFCEGAEITITGTGEPDLFIANNKYSGGYIGIKSLGDIVFDDTTVTVHYDIIPGNRTYVAAIRGIAGDQERSALTLKNGSSFSMTLDNADSLAVVGIGMFASASIEDSTVALDLSSTGSTGGIGDRNVQDLTSLTIKDARIDVKTATSGEEAVWGIRACGTLEISLSDCASYVHSTATGGPALAAVIGTTEEESIPFDPDYTPTLLLLINGVEVNQPADGVVSRAMLPYLYEMSEAVETIFDPSNSAEPAAEVYLRGPHTWDAPVSVTDKENGITTETYTCSICGETKETTTPCIGWIKIDGKWYLFDDQSTLLTGWQQVNGKWYYLAGDGAMQTGWQKINGKWYYMRSGGAMVTGWQQINGKWYWFAAGGSMKTGWLSSDGKWYWLKDNGSMATGWQKINGKWYWFAAGGSMKTGWLSLNGTWYWLKDNGAMATGWQQINGKWYWFDNSGAMYANGTKTINGKTYTFNASGAWIK